MNPSPHARGTATEVAAYFLRLGIIAFGGPAAHIALMRRELVQQRRWLTDAEFVDLLGVTYLIPGPNSTEMTMHLGGQRAGWHGLWIGGACFIAPAVAIVLALAWMYERWGTTAAGEGLLWGIQPLVLAIIVQAIFGLRSAAVKGWWTAAVVAAAIALSLLGVNQLVVLLGAGLLPLAFFEGRRLMAHARGKAAAFVPLALFASENASRSLLELFLVFLKIGGLLYGSGYVLFAFLEDEFVTNRGWLSREVLLDAIAVGQFTPGPLFTSATFVGYSVRGWEGAAVATIGIFLPSFVFVALTHPLIPRLRQSRRLSPFLDGVNAAAIALMAVVTLSLARETVDSPAAIVLFGIGAVVLVRFQPNSAWLVLAGALIGLTRQALL